MTSITFMIGPSREEPCLLTNRLAHAGIVIPRPSGIQHRWRQPVGRSTGGAYVLSDLEGMDWAYGVGAQQTYRTMKNLFNPLNPWVWIHMLDPRSETAVWVEAMMQEPSVVRGVGFTIQSMTVSFHTVLRT